MKGKKFLSAVLFFALLPGMVMAQEPDGVPQRGISGSGITVKLELPSYEIVQDEEGFHAIRVEGFSSFGLPGDPWLPRKVYNVAVPPDAALGSLTLEVVDVQVVRLPGPYQLKPASPDIISEDSEGDAGVHPSSDAPASDTAPANFVRLLFPGQMRKWRFARLEFTPFQVDAATGELSVASEMTVRINYGVSPVAKDEALLKDRVMDGVAQQLLINYGAARAWYQVTSGRENQTPDILRDHRERRSKNWWPQVAQSITHKPSRDEPGVVYDYVIITTNAIEAGSSKLANFIAHKQGQGYSVLTITEDEYGGLVGQPPNGTAEKIRKWLQDNYIAYSIEYVLLIGDPDPSGDVPMKMCWPRNHKATYKEAPTDYFYADLTGNWDLDGDQVYGEWVGDTGVGGVDFANEVYVGRIPVYDADYATLDNILQKIMDYENEPGPASWRESALLPMSFSDVGYDGAPLSEQMMDDYVTAAGFATWTQYQQGNGACSLDSIYPSDEELRGGTVVRDRWAANDYGLVLWWGHGSATSASVGYDGCWDGNLFSSGDAASLDDDHPSFTYQCSCLNGYPENTNNLQYAILKQGGIGTTSATRVSWFNTGVGYGDFDGSTTNSGIGYEYAKRLVEGQAAGNALYNAKASMTPEFDTRLMNFYDFNLYGDPSTGLFVFGELPPACYDILFDETHGWASDVHGDYTIEDLYSELAAFLEGHGHTVDSLQDPNPFDYATISQYDVLVLVLPQEYYSDGEKNAIAQFVEEGRRLVTISEWGGFADVSRDILNDVHAHLGDGLFHNYDEVYDPTDYEVFDYWPLIHVFSPDPVNNGVSTVVEYFGSSLDVSGPGYGTAFGDDDTYTAPSPLKVAPEGGPTDATIGLGIEVAPGPSADSSPLVPRERIPGVADLSDIPYRGSPGPAAPRTETEVANLSDIPHRGSPGPAAPGDVIENFPNTWDSSTMGLVYDQIGDGVLYAHESQPNPTIHYVDYTVPHPWMFSWSLSGLNPTWPPSLDNRDGAGHHRLLDHVFLPDFQGDLNIADDNIVEVQWGGIILNAWETDGAGNDSYDGSAIDMIIDIAVVPGTPDRYFATAAYDGSVVYEIDLIKAGWWAPNSWGTLNTCTVPGLDDNLGIDYDEDHGVLYHSDANSVKIVITDLNCNLIDAFQCISPLASNTGVTYIEGKIPPEIWVTDPSSNSTTRCEAPQVIVQAMSNVGAGDVFAVGDANLWDNEDHDGDTILSLYEYDNEQLAWNVFAYGQECVNTPPTISGLPDAIIDHTTPLPVQIDLWAYAFDNETPDSGLTYTIEGSPPPGAGVSIVGNRWLTVNPSASWCGYTDVTVRVTDPGGLWDNDTLRVAVSWSCQG